VAEDWAGKMPALPNDVRLLCAPSQPDEYRWPRCYDDVLNEQTGFA